MYKTSDSVLFVRKNFETLVRKYAHKHIVIANGEIFTGKNAVKKARKKYPDTVPLSMPIPGPEAFPHHLL